MIGTFITIGLIVAGAMALAVAVYVFVVRRRLRKALNQQYFVGHWKELQRLLTNKKAWPDAIMDADKLLDEALKKKRIRGQGMGERLVKAQRILTDNDSVWFGHKLRNKIEHEPDMKLKETEVKQALVGIRQALKDLGALPDGQQRDTK